MPDSESHPRRKRTRRMDGVGKGREGMRTLPAFSHLELQLELFLDQVVDGVSKTDVSVAVEGQFPGRPEDPF